MSVAYYRTMEGDVLDLISFSHYGDEHGLVPIMQANPRLSLNDEVLGAGIVITLPDLTLPQEPVIALWD